jgi:hypothetical protein
MKNQTLKTLLIGLIVLGFCLNTMAQDARERNYM